MSLYFVFCFKQKSAYEVLISDWSSDVCCSDLLPNWEKAVAAALWFLDAVPEVRSVNVGGGLGLPHRALDQPLDLARWAAVLRRQFAGRNVAIAVEPGDYTVTDAGMLLLSVPDVEWKLDFRCVFVNGWFNLHPEPAFYYLPFAPGPYTPRRGG